MDTNRTHLQKNEILYDRYRIQSLLGSGGMGTVYLAEDLRLQGKQWAIKETRIETEFYEKFVDEAKMLVDLDHPNLPKIVDYYSPDDQGYIYLVMDYIKGTTLLDLFEKNQRYLPFQQVLHYSVQICDLLHYLHHQPQPIIYRDLKPTNVMINESGNVKLIDFGIARKYKEGKQEDTVQIGTTGFAAPEQFENLQTDHRTDLFSLGAMMYFLLSGGKYIYSTQKKLDYFRHDLPSALIEAVSHLVKLSPEERYQSAIEVKQVLQQITQGQGDGLEPTELLTENMGYAGLHRNESGSGVAPGSGNHQDANKGGVDETELLGSEDPPSGVWDRHAFKRHTFKADTARAYEDEFVGKVMIGVVGATRRTGATHTAIQVAKFLAGMTFKVACVEVKHESRPNVFHTFQTELPSRYAEGGFHLEGIDFFRNNTGLLNVYSAGYDYVVLDAGYIEVEHDGQQEYLREFVRADIQVLTIGSSLWDFYDLNQTFTYFEEQRLKIPHHVMVNYADEEIFREIKKSYTRKELKELNIHFYQKPFQPNAFDDGKHQEPYRQILKSVLPQHKSKKKLLFWK